MHYALVSDLLSRDEFDELVEKKCSELGGNVDDNVASMLVAEDLGRSHIRIGDIRSSKTQLVCFFGKVLEVSEPHEFLRGGSLESGEAEKGLVSHMILGDPTGTVKLTLWDSFAAACADIPIGTVLEVAAKPIPYKNEAVCTAMRESCAEIVETKKPPHSEVMDSPLRVRILVKNPIHEFIRQDSTPSAFQEFIVGSGFETSKLIAWEPSVFENIDEGMSVSIEGAAVKEYDGNAEYSCNESSVVTLISENISVHTIDADDVKEGANSIVKGIVSYVSEIRRFTTRRGTESCVRNLMIKGSHGSTVRAALWGDAADDVFIAGDEVLIINSSAKLNKYGNLEFSIGRGSAVRRAEKSQEYVSVQGIAVKRAEGQSIDNGNEVWLIADDVSLKDAVCYKVSGMCSGGRIYADEITEIPQNSESVMELLKSVKEDCS